MVSIEYDEFGAAQELERGRADGEPTSDVAHHDISHRSSAPKDHEAIPRSVDLLGYGAHYLSKMSLAAHALARGELFDDPKVARATLEVEKLSAQLNGRRSTGSARSAPSL